jgi:hypothetical protein
MICFISSFLGPTSISVGGSVTKNPPPGDAIKDFKVTCVHQTVIRFKYIYRFAACC